MRAHGAKAAVTALCALLLAVRGLSAQSAAELAAQCAAAGGDATMCAVGAGAGRDLAGYIGLLAAPGTEVPGQPSTLGRRLGGAPRVGISLRGAGMSVVVPDLSDAAGARARSHFVPTAQYTMALGAYDGLSVLPTVGGVLSLDVLASGSVSLFPASEGFDGKLAVVSVGARVGLLRESFTLPAVTVSVARRFSGELSFGREIAGDLGYVAVHPGITSIRATVGKDLFAFGVLAGVGWDDLSSVTTLSVTDGAGGFTFDNADVDASRRTYFAGLSRQLGVLSWLSGEIGWVQAFEPVTGGVSASPDPGRQLYGSVALVLRL